MMRKLKGAARALRGGEREKYVVAEWLSNRIVPSHFFGESSKVWFSEAKEGLGLEHFRDEELRRRWDRLWTLGQIARLCKRLPGDLVEMGVFTGASAAVMLREGGASQRYYGFDSFRGLSTPDPDIDGSYWASGDLESEKSRALRNLGGWLERVSLVEGWIPDVFSESVGPDAVALAHIDVDLYEPTLASLEWVSNRVVDGAIIVCDDYGFETCPGRDAP